jgi:hypothetical protein
MIYALQNSINNWDDPEDFKPVSDARSGHVWPTEADVDGWCVWRGRCGGVALQQMAAVKRPSVCTPRHLLQRDTPPSPPRRHKLQHMRHSTCSHQHQHSIHTKTQERWLDNPDCAYVPNSSGSEASLDGERRVRRFAPFSDGIKACLGQVRHWARQWWQWDDGPALSGLVCRVSWAPVRCTQACTALTPTTHPHSDT